MKMKRRVLVAAFAAITLLMVPAVTVSAQTITVDTEGPEYTGDYLLTVNTDTKFDFSKGYSESRDTDLNANWESTGIPGAAGPSGAIEASVLGASAADASSFSGAALDEWRLTSAADSSVETENSVTEVYKVGDTRNFSSTMYYGSDGLKATDFTAECVAVTDSCTIWYNSCKELSLQHSKKEVADLAGRLQACAEKQAASYGNSDRIDVDHDGKVAFVFYPFSKDRTLGFFNDADLAENAMDMLNMNSHPMDNGKLLPIEGDLGVLVHEWQHLINCAQTGGQSSIDMTSMESMAKDQYKIRAYTWLNECFSQSAFRLNGLEPGIITKQCQTANTYMELYGKSLTMPFVFEGLYVPVENPLRGGTYVNWYLFGRYLSAQTEGYTGGGDSIYKTILNSDRGSFTDPNTGKLVTDVGKCDNATLEKALLDMGYLGTGKNAKAKDLNEMLRNFILATYFRQGSGVYSLGGCGKFDLSTFDTAKANTVAETPQKLPGGYSACLTKINRTGSITVDDAAAGADIRHFGITVKYDGVKVNETKNSDGTKTVTLSTTDKDAGIYYTTNGDLPHKDNGILYRGPITVPQSTTIEAISADAFGESGENGSFGLPFVVGFTGSNRYMTSSVVVKNNFNTGVDTAVLVSGENWPDALTAAALAGVKECPVIITQKNTLTQATSDLLSELGVANVTIVGGKSAVSQAVEDALTAKNGIAPAKIERIAGDNRVKTAEKVGAAVSAQSDSDTCFICSGNNFPDALSASSCAYRKKAPILLTRKDGTLSDTTLTMAKSFANIYIIGGTAAVGSGVEEQLVSAGTSVPVRLAGTNRYGTSVAVNNQFYPDSIDLLTVVTGDNFPDAITAAARDTGADVEGSILLVNGKSGTLTKDQVSVMQRLHTVDGGATVGGEGALSSATRAAITDAIVNDPIKQMTNVYSMMMARKTTAEPLLRTVNEFPGLICEECSFLSDKGSKLVGYKYSKKDLVPRGVIIMAHGLGPGGQCVYMDQADYFTSNGYLVFAYDATGNDKSEGDSGIGIQQGILDLDKAIEYVEADSVMKNYPIGLYGHSWGAYCVSAVLKDHPEVKAVAEISGFNESQDVFENAYGKNLFTSYTWFIEMQMFGNHAFYTSIKGFEKSKADVLVVHSEDDKNVPISIGYDMYYEKYKADSRFTFLKYTARGHLYIFYTDAARAYDEAYDQARTAYFVEKHLQDTTENRNAYYKNHPFDKKTGFELDRTFMGNILAFFNRNVSN